MRRPRIDVLGDGSEHSELVSARFDFLLSSLLDNATYPGVLRKTGMLKLMLQTDKESLRVWTREEKAFFVTVGSIGVSDTATSWSGREFFLGENGSVFTRERRPEVNGCLYAIKQPFYYASTEDITCVESFEPPIMASVYGDTAKDLRSMYRIGFLNPRGLREGEIQHISAPSSVKI